MELVVIGHIMIENIYYHNGNKIGPVLGGPASYSSVCASTLGTKTGLVTVIGRDMPYYLIEPFIKSGVNIKGINIIGENSRATDLKYGPNGEKKAYYKKVAPIINYNHIPDEYLNAKSFFICPQDFEIELDMISSLRNNGRLLMTDLGGFGGVVSTRHPINGEMEIVKNIVSNFNIVKASIEDCNYLFKDTQDYEKIMDRLHNWGAEIVILTRGEKGSIISDKREIIEYKGIKVKVVDTTGAGDVYCAAFLSKFMETNNLQESGMHANMVASFLTTKKGGVDIERIPSKKMLRDFKIKFGN